MIRPKHPRPARSDESAAPDTSSLIDVAFLLRFNCLAGVGITNIAIHGSTDPADR